MRLSAADSIRDKTARGQSISMDEFQVVLVGGILDRQTGISEDQRKRYASMDVKSGYVSTNGMERRFAIESVSPRTGPTCASDFPGFPWDEEADKVIKSFQRDTDETLTHLHNRKEQCKPLFDYIIRNRASELTPLQVLALHNIDNLIKMRKRAEDSIDNLENEDSDIEIKFRKTLDALYEEFIDEKVASGWTREMAIKDYEAESKRARVRFARTYNADEGKPRFDPRPSNLGLLQNMYKFDSEPKPRHWEKTRLKKKRLNTLE